MMSRFLWRLVGSAGEHGDGDGSSEDNGGCLDGCNGGYGGVGKGACVPRTLFTLRRFG